MGDQAAQAHRVHRDAVDPAAARAVGVLGGGIRHVAETGVATRAAAMRWAVRAAVPDGASTCWGGAAR